MIPFEWISIAVAAASAFFAYRANCHAKRITRPYFNFKLIDGCYLCLENFGHAPAEQIKIRGKRGYSKNNESPKNADKEYNITIESCPPGQAIHLESHVNLSKDYDKFSITISYTDQYTKEKYVDRLNVILMKAAATLMIESQNSTNSEKEFSAALRFLSKFYIKFK